MKSKIISLAVVSLIILFSSPAFAAEKSVKVDLQKIDSDNDGMSDWQELFFYQTNTKNSDTDGDGYDDLMEIKNGFSPHNQTLGTKFTKRIEINTKKQELTYYFDEKKINTFVVSTGKVAMPTPKGAFKIKNKYERAWSKKYGLWMPYWMGLKDGSFGLHELPEWPNGYKEGQAHLGKAVSHGCVRLGIGQAELLFNWADIGTPVNIQ